MYKMEQKYTFKYTKIVCKKCTPTISEYVISYVIVLYWKNMWYIYQRIGMYKMKQKYTFILK